jgi:nucleotide-binding universal stress UspA family protein
MLTASPTADSKMIDRARCSNEDRLDAHASVEPTATLSAIKPFLPRGTTLWSRHTFAEGAIMFKHLLIPTDGSQLSESAALKSIQLARTLGGHVTALHVSPSFHVMTYRAEMLEGTRGEYERDSKVHADRYLAFVSKAAAEAGVACDTVSRVSDNVYESIIDLARERGCDAIAMASHGRRGIAGVLLGSETQHVLTHSTVPVVVWR